MDFFEIFMVLNTCWVRNVLIWRGGIVLIDLKNGNHMVFGEYEKWKIDYFRSIILVLKNFLWYYTINKIQVELKKEGYTSIWTGVMALYAREKLQTFGFRSITKV